METTILSELIKTSPVLGVILTLWFYQRKDSEKRSEDYKEFVNKVQDENLTREKDLQEVISKNQNIIQELTGNIRHDIQDIKEKVDKLVN